MRSPTASQGEGGALGEEEARKRGNTVGIRDQAMDIAKINNQKITRLPTPTASDKNDRQRLENWHGNDLVSTVKAEILFPTPNTMDMLPARDPSKIDKSKGVFANVRETVINDLLPTTRTSMANGPTQKEIAEGNPKTRIETEVMLGDVNWGKFEPAIRRWEETLGRPAPAPTKPDGKDGAHRLSSAFTEWMMGVPEGWITDCGLTRNESLKACGNGVVPQQAELALRVLLEGIAPPRGGQVNLPTPTVSDTFTDNLASSQQKPGSMHSVTLPQAVRWVASE